MSVDLEKHVNIFLANLAIARIRSSSVESSSEVISQDIDNEDDYNPSYDHGSSQGEKVSFANKASLKSWLKKGKSI